MAPRKKSGVWNYFQETSNPEKPECKLCGMESVRRGGNTNQMTGHLKQHHKAEYELVAKQKGEQVTRARQCVEIMAENPMITASLFTTRSFLGLFPPSEHSTFPSRTTLMSRTIPDMANEIREENRKKLSGRPVCLVIDSWTAKNGIVCLTAILAYYVTDQWTQEGVLLEAKRTRGKHTARRLADLIKEVIDAYSLEVTAIMSDSAANIRAAVRLLGIFNPRCCSHLLHIGVRKGISSWKGRGTLKKVRGFARLLNKSATSREEFFQYCEEANLRPVVVSQSIDTRWNSEFHSVARVNEQMAAVNRLLAGAPHKEKFKSNEIVRLRLLEGVLQKLSMITSMVCRESTHLGEALLAFHEAKAHLKSIMDEEEKETKSLARTIREELKKKESYYRKDKDVLLHTLFDPAKVACLQSIQWEKVAKLIPAPAPAPSTNSAPSPVAATPYKKASNMKASSVYSAFAKPSTTPLAARTSAIEFEIQKYLSECRGGDVDIDTSALDFWKSRNNQYPILSVMSKRYLSVPCTSVSAERVFSIAGLIYRCHLRSLLSADRGGDILLLRTHRLKLFRSISALPPMAVVSSSTIPDQNETHSVEKDEKESDDEMDISDAERGIDEDRYSTGDVSDMDLGDSDDDLDASDDGMNEESSSDEEEL